MDAWQTGSMVVDQFISLLVTLRSIVMRKQTLELSDLVLTACYLIVMFAGHVLAAKKMGGFAPWDAALRRFMSGTCKGTMINKWRNSYWKVSSLELRIRCYQTAASVHHFTDSTGRLQSMSLLQSLRSQTPKGLDSRSRAVQLQNRNFHAKHLLPPVPYLDCN